MFSEVAGVLEVPTSDWVCSGGSSCGCDDDGEGSCGSYFCCDDGGCGGSVDDALRWLR